MEKLIKLLDEYDHKKTEDLERWKQRVENQKLWIISKQSWFIKRLLKNDKIDWLKFYGENEYTPIWVNAKSDIDQVYSIEEQILMILSISDTPIDDLVSYLK